MNAPLPVPPTGAPIGPVLRAEEVAKLLNYSAARTFHERRTTLEAKGFPPKLPGINGWSRACVLRWIETNGETYLPATPEALPAGDVLAERYGS